MTLSIIIPVYNHAQELRKCIQSIYRQTLWSSVQLSDVEVIVVNDGSTDGLGAMVECGELGVTEFVFQYIDQANRGAAAARNVGFEHSTGEYVFFCDADIQLKMDCLEKMLKALKQNPNAAFAYSQFQFGWKVFSSSPFDAVKLKQLNYIHTSSLIRRSAFPGFDETLKKFQDWDLFLTIAEKGGIGVFIPEVLFTIKQRRTGMSQWVPAFAYHWPWNKLPWWKSTIQKYNNAKKVIAQIHHL